MQGKTTGGDVIDALPEAHGKSARIEQRAAIQFRYLVVRDFAIEPAGHGDPPEMAVKFYSMAGQTANRFLGWPADPFCFRLHCQGTFESRGPPGIRPTAAGFVVPPLVPATRHHQWRNHSGGRQPV